MKEDIIISTKGVYVLPMSLTFKGTVTFPKLNINSKK